MKLFDKSHWSNASQSRTAVASQPHPHHHRHLTSIRAELTRQQAHFVTSIIVTWLEAFADHPLRGQDKDDKYLELL